MVNDIVIFDLEIVKIEDEQNKIIEFAAIQICEGQLQKSCHFLIQPASSLFDYRQEILNFFEDSVLVCHHGSFYLAILEGRLNVHFSQPLWDTTQLARIFYPTSHNYQLAYLAEQIPLPICDESKPHKSEKNAWLTWKLLESCNQKGLQFDLSFFDQTKSILEGWVGRSFFDGMRSEITRRFPDRAIRTEFVLAKVSEGLFSHGQTKTMLFPESVDWVVNCFSPGGILERSLPSYESRIGQVKMAKLVADSLSSSHHVAVEAGTGTGKSFAYLIPSVWSAKKTGQKVVVATHTIPLQEQLQKKDIPILKAMLPFPFRASVLKGRANYCCLKKLQGCLINPLEYFSEEQKLAFLSILVWLKETVVGDVQELSTVPGIMNIWPKIGADNDTCNPGRCSKAGSCFLLRARKKAEESDVLIVNHSLLFSDLKTDFNVLPEYHHLVIDEAHQIYQTALQHLGSDLSLEKINHLTGNIYKPTGLNFYGTLKQRLTSLPFLVPSIDWNIFEKRLDSIPQKCPMIGEQTKELFELLSAILGSERTFRFIKSHMAKTWWQELNIQIENLIGRLKEMVTVLESLTSILYGEVADVVEELRYSIANHQRELLAVLDTLSQVIDVSNPKQVTWLEQNSRLYLKTSPIEVSDILKEKIFSRLDSVILTSATLSISNSFDHFLGDIGLPKATITAQVDSPFDYESQMRLFVVKNGINLLESDEEKASGLAEFIAEVAERMNGRTLVLFTSHRLLRETYASLQIKLARIGIETLAQGIHGERTTIMESFKKNPRSVLLGANSFWEGIDIPGDSLTCVILVKLPFWPPSLPLIEARSEFLKSLGRDPFQELLLPEAVIRFKQGFGRLIRSKEDRGVVILLDDRVIKKYYGKFFLNSLPIGRHFLGDKELVLTKVEEWKAGGENKSFYNGHKNVKLEEIQEGEVI